MRWKTKVGHWSLRNPLPGAIALISFLVLALSPARVEGEGRVHALLINGGHNATSNYLSHLHHLEDMVELLAERGLESERIHIFSADGESDAADLASRDSLPKDFWLIEGTTTGKRLRPRTRLTIVCLTNLTLPAHCPME